MNNEEIQQIILNVSKKLKIDCEKYKEDYGLANRSLILFATLEESSRVVRSEGTDEDRDIMICYDENGWFIYDSVVQVGAGVQKIIKDDINGISEKEVLEKYQQLKLIEKMKFISTAYKILCY